MLDRPGLLAALERDAGRPLTLIVADAGWGKSTLAAAFARRAHRPVVWYALLPSDADLRVFGRHLVEGFRRDTPRFGNGFLRALEATRPSASGAEVLAESFAEALAGLKGPPRLLVLDDLQSIEGGEVPGFLNSLLRVLPATLRVLATTRGAPTLALERMRVRGELAELDAANLRLTRPEIAALAARRTAKRLDEPALERLEAATGGWPTAVQLVLNAMESEPARTMDSVLGELGMPHVRLGAFFSAEIYVQFEPATRDLLCATAPLDRFDSALAAALNPGLRPGPILRRLVQRGFLRSFGEGDETTYEWHALVRGFVRQEVEAAEGEGAWAMREATVAGVLRARGETERAMRHALNAGDSASAAELLVLLGPGLLAQGRAGTLLGFVTDLGESVVDARPALTLAAADALAALGRWDDARTRYERALERARAAADPERECQALLGLGKVLNLRGEHEQVLGMAERGLAAAWEPPLALRARLLQMKASAHFYLGQHRAAIAVLDQVRAMLPADAEPELVLPTLHNLAIARASQGGFREAAEPLREAIARVRGTDSPREPLYLSNLAFLLLEVGELADARKAAEDGLAAAQRFANRAQQATCHEALAEILAQRGDVDGALAELKRAESLHEALRMEVITPDLLAARGRIFCLHGQYRRGAEFLQRAIERAGERPDTPRLVSFRAQLAWCELRAGRAHAARGILQELLPQAERGGNDDERMRVHWWLAEALLAGGERAKARPHLVAALTLARERDYRHFLRLRAREDASALLEALRSGCELDLCADALVAAGPGIEDALIEVAGSSAPVIAEAAIAVLAETGGAVSLERLPPLARRRRAISGAVRRSLLPIEGRMRRSEPGRDAATEPPRLVAFGPPRLEIAGRPLPASAWRSQRAFHVLLLLAARPRGATREQLLEAFWPGRNLAAGRRNFHPTLSYLRSVMPRHSAPPLLREAETYRIHPDYPLRCDLWEFDDALAAARRAGSDEERLATTERALALAERPALEGLYDGWAQEIEHALRDRIETACLAAGTLRQRKGDPEAALVHFRRACEIDIFRETTHVQLVECLVETGNRGAALAAIERLRTLLRRELAVDPLPETEEAFRAALGARSADPQRTANPKSARALHDSLKS